MTQKYHIIFIVLPLFIGVYSTAICQKIYNTDAFSKIKIYTEKEVNSANLESSPAFYGDKIAFVVTTEKGKIFDKEIDEPYFDLGFATVHPDNSLGTKSNFDKRINSDLHEGPLTYDAITNKLYFTRSVKEKRSVKGIEFDTAWLRIMVADMNLSKPSVDPLNINTDRYSVCHPTLTGDGKTMIFSSNRPGGKGGMDLYTTYFDGQAWTGIINLGDDINTPANEVFPFLLNDTLLMFSSERVSGSGGLDMYVTVLNDGSWMESQILPKPLNSSFDDLGLIVRENGKSGYFTSNRPGGNGKDDIYRFESGIPLFNIDPDVQIETQVTVLDKLTLEPVPEVNVTVTPLDIDVNNFTLSSYNVDMLSGKDPGDLVLKLTPKKGTSLPVLITDSIGNATFRLPKSQKYLIGFTCENYSDITLIYDYVTFGDHFNMVLEPQNDEIADDAEGVSAAIREMADPNGPEKLTIPTEKGSVIVFENIYYEYNSSNILKGAANELNTLAMTMEKNPDMSVRLESHTDSRGTAAYNLQLSINRAEAVRKYLTSLGIEEDRITIKGYGESKLRNECTDKVACPEAKHRYNRRTEVVIER
ncbi:MAG: OmpA family protein [Saprospiraceae bacterium]|nr:OmpA family protein [Saprospiraceae bacterium]